MSKVYYQLGNIFGQPVLVELDKDDVSTKAMVAQYIKADGLPQYINADTSMEAKWFEETYQLFDMPPVVEATKETANDPAHPHTK